MLKEALACAALSMGLQAPDLEPNWLPHRPTQEELNWLGTQVPEYGSLQRQEGYIKGLYIRRWELIITEPRFDYLTHEACHFLQHMQGQGFSEKQCYRVQKECQK